MEGRYRSSGVILVLVHIYKIVWKGSVLKCALFRAVGPLINQARSPGVGLIRRDIKHCYFQG